MIIKVKLEGELLEALKKDAEQNLRTHPAQIIYYLRQIYADQLGAIPAPSITTVGQVKTTEVTITKQEELAGEPLVHLQEIEGHQIGCVIQQDDTIDIPDDILNF